jgi:hypothetical protein
VSLVLEALKKLDREKGRDERGFVVMAAAPWPTRAARQWPAWAALAVATAGAVVAVLALRPSPAPPPAAVRPAALPEPAPVVAAPPPAIPNPNAAVVRPAPARVAPKPVVAPTAVPAAETDPRLQAISERDGQPIAIINDRLVRVGDEVDGMRVLDIRGAEVDVEVRGRRTTLRF